MVDESSRVGSVGSVAEETARLLEALFGGEASPQQAPPQQAPQQQSPQQQPPPQQPPRAAPPDSTPDAAGEGESEPGTRHTEVCGACGQQVGAEPPGPGTDPASGVCHLCPVCRLISAVRSVRPETVERLADLAAALTQTLREMAATRWAETGQPAAERHRSSVEDIDVHDGQPDGDEEDGDMTDLTDEPDPTDAGTHP